MMRCYNGCPDSELRALWDDEEKVHKILKEEGLRATYFPVECKWMVFNSRHLSVTGFHDTLQQAAAAALSKL